MPRYNFALIIAVLYVASTGCSEKPSGVQRAPRAVSYVTLRTSEPGASSRLTGTVESWKREDIGFEVAGRLLSIVEPGVDIVGRTFDEEGKLLSEGTTLAELDDERYRIAAKQAQTAADAARTDLEEVVPQMLAEAQAALALADKELERYTNLVRSQSAPQQQLDVAETAQKAATAKVAQVEALRATKASLLSSSLAAVEQAEVNIKDCKLRSPFTGQIARVHVIPGGYVLPGQPVVSVQMMDPMKVQVAVSPEIDKGVRFNDRVRVYLDDTAEYVEGYVYLKDTYADPATRTYLITLLVRNKKTVSGIPEELQGSSVATTRKLWTLLPEKMGEESNFFIDVDSLQQDDQGYFVWKVDNLTADQLYENFDSVLEVSKVRVQPGEGRVPALQVFIFRELIDIGELDPATSVILGEVDGQVVDGKVVLVQERWQLRPGDLAQINLRNQAAPGGYYVPRVAIMSDGEDNYIYVVRKDESKATRVPVDPLDTSGQSQRVEAAADVPLMPGDRVIVGGVHYVMDGEEISLVEELEAML